MPPTGVEAMLVLRQMRIWASAYGISMGSFREGPLTMKMVPVSAFSGRPPSDGGLKRGSRHVPVHAGLGSILASARDSL